jgi:hypothetical protein
MQDQFDSDQDTVWYLLFLAELVEKVTASQEMDSAME